MDDTNRYLERYLEGEAHAFDEIVEAHQASLLRFATGLVGSRDRAQDVVQEAFIRLLRAASNLKDGTKLQSWLFRTCRNLAIDVIRKEKSVERVEQEASARELQPDRSMDGHVEKNELIATVKDRLKKLTRNEQACIVLKIIEGKSYKEIAEVTGLSTSNVGFQIHNGLKRLSAFVGAVAGN